MSSNSYKNKLSSSEIKQVELQILNYVSSVCDKLGLRYYLAYGTLIGAIRHKGFIPWDDDIDIVMPRDDYNKLLSYLKNEDVSSSYKCLIPQKDGYFYEFAKIIDQSTLYSDSRTYAKPSGLWIDIFPLDGLDKKDKLSHYILLFLNRCRVASVNRYLPNKTRGLMIPFVYIFWKICRLTGYGFFLKKSIKISQKYKYDECDYVGYASSYPAHNKYLKKEWFRDFVYVDFENYKFKAPVGYNEYLTSQYGDYMKMPPEDRRHNHVPYQLDFGDEK